MVEVPKLAEEISELRYSALNHLWMHNRDWVKTGEDGGPDIVVDGDGIKVYLSILKITQNRIRPLMRKPYQT